MVERNLAGSVQRESDRFGNTLYGLGKDILKNRFGSRASRAVDRATGRTPSVLPDNATRFAQLLSRYGRVVGVFVLSTVAYTTPVHWAWYALLGSITTYLAGSLVGRGMDPVR